MKGGKRGGKGGSAGWGDQLVRGLIAQGKLPRDALERSTSAVRASAAATPAPPLLVAQAAPEREMSSVERAYALHLDTRKALGEIKGWSYEPEALALVGDCSYTPDFRVVALDGWIEWHETKGGRVMDDSIVKFKWAASLYRDQRFFWIQRKRRAWTIRRRLEDGWQR